MDLGLRGKRALVCAASKGLGRGCALALAQEGVEVTILARGVETLEATAAEIRAATGVPVTSVAGDITTAAGRAAALAACPDPDILVNNAGGPPPGDFMEWDGEDWHRALDANMVTPILLMQAVIPAMKARGFGRIVNITSAAVRAPIAVLGLSNGARTGLTGFVAGLARQVAPHGITINNLLPGLFATERLDKTIIAMAAAEGRSEADIREARRRSAPVGRFGTPEEFGAACAFLCSQQAGYIVGQNWLLDGGAFPGTM